MPALSKSVAAALRDYLADPKKAANKAQLNATFDELEWPPAGERIPLADELTPAQREAATLLATSDDNHWDRAMPKLAWSKRRWLGIDPPGGLEQTVTLEGKRVPLWFAIGYDRPELHTDDFYDHVQGLPYSNRVPAYIEIQLGAYHFGSDDAYGDASSYLSPFDFKSLSKKDAKWAGDYADWLLQLFGNKRVPHLTRMFIFPALIHSQAPWQARWSRLAYWNNGQPESAERIVAIPEEHREAALLTVIDDDVHHTRLPEILEKVDSPKAIARLIKALPEILDSYPPYVRQILPKLKTIAKRNPDFAKVLAKHLPKLEKKKKR
jgi:hypothetical protein